MLLSSLPSIRWRSASPRSSSSVLAACGRRRVAAAGRISKAYILDLLAFAVEIGRLTEACADVVRRLVQCDDIQLVAPMAVPPEPRHDSVEDAWQPTTTDQRTVTIDEDTVSREVRFRKIYNEDGVRAIACGLTPFDLRASIDGARRPSADFHSRFPREFPSADRPSEDEVFGDYNTLEDLLSKLELVRGTPAELIQTAVRTKRDLVRQLLDHPRHGGARIARPDMYRRLVRALDQRAPPEQRLLKQSRSPRQVLKQPCKADAPVPSCWSRKMSAGSQLFDRPTKLSDYVRDDLAPPH